MDHQDRWFSTASPATIRREKGHDFDAACGQLLLKQQTAEGLLEAEITKTMKP